MKPVFADSFYYLALLNSSDEAHLPARRFSADFTGRIVTTAWILTEVGDALADPRFRPLFVNLIRSIEADRKTIVVGPTRPVYDEGLSLYSRRLDKEWSLTDCISFAVMRKRGLSQALTGDRHFEQAGFEVLL